MPLPWRAISLRIKLAAIIITALVAGGGALAAFSAAPYALASHTYVDDKVDSALMVATARIGNLQRDQSETRLQLNQMRREGLRTTRWNLSEQLKFAPDTPTRRILQERIEQIDDDLRDVNAERDKLKAFSTP